jgi:hypothetical protein
MSCHAITLDKVSSAPPKVVFLTDVVFGRLLSHTTEILEFVINFKQLILWCQDQINNELQSMKPIANGINL